MKSWRNGWSAVEQTPSQEKFITWPFSPPKDEEVIQRLEQRSYDTEEKIKVRLDQFKTNVEAVKDSYTDIMVTVDGNKASTEVSCVIMNTNEEMTGTKA
jgi:adenylate kinase